jgi:hypothetical protein
MPEVLESELRKGDEPHWINARGYVSRQLPKNLPANASGRTGNDAQHYGT